MATQKLLRVSFDANDAKEALTKSIPSMDSGFNINTAHGDIALHGDDARQVMEVVMRIAKHRAKALDRAKDCSLSLDV